MPDPNKPEKMPISLPVTRNMQGLEVKKVQMWLNDLNEHYKFNPKKELPISGFFGDQTVAMLKEFQKFCNLTPNGMYDAVTHDMVEWKFWNMMRNLEIARKRAQDEAIMGARKW